MQMNEDLVVSCADMARNDPLVQNITYNTKGLLLWSCSYSDASVTAQNLQDLNYLQQLPCSEPSIKLKCQNKSLTTLLQFST